MDMKPRRPPSFKVRPRGASVAFLTSKFNALAAGSETPSSGARRRTRRSGSSRRTTVVSNGPHVAKARMRFETDVPEAVYDDAGPLQQQLQPNHSFLWGGRVSAPPEKEEEEEEMPYDDVGPLMPGVKMNGLFQEKDEGPSKGGIEACSSDELYDDVGAPASVYEDVSSLERVNSIYESTTPMNDDWVTDEESESPAPTSAPRRLPKGRRTRRARTASRLSSRAARISTTRICKEESSSEPDDYYEVVGRNINTAPVIANPNPPPALIQPSFDEGVDSYDSFDSTDSEHDNKPLPEPIVSNSNPYAIAKIGKQMLKFKKRMSQLIPKQPPPLPPPNPPEVIQPDLQQPTSASPPRRKYWTLGRFKRSTSTPGGLGSARFYLAPSELQGNGHSESKTPPATTNGTAGPALPGKRRSYPSARPPGPPPPLPPGAVAKKSTSASWYAECGLFDGSKPPSASSSYSSWYAEAGLYAASTVTSGGSSTSGSTTAPSNLDENSRFVNEPLYQFYTASVAKRELEAGSKETDSISGGERTDSDGYEEIGAGIGSDSTTQIHNNRPSVMELSRGHSGQRTLWCQLPEVVESGVLDRLTSQQRRLQEAKFELLTSEASYVRSLSVLEVHFEQAESLRSESVLPREDRRSLFGDVTSVREAAKGFLAELERCWQSSVIMDGVSQLVQAHVQRAAKPYIRYCSNQVHRDRTLRRLRGETRFSEALSKAESAPECHSLSLHSFLMLPMQRVTRLPLLMDAILARLDYSEQNNERPAAEAAFAACAELVQRCNDEARKMERVEEMLLLSRQIHFPKAIRAIPIVSNQRWLVRAGPLTHLAPRGGGAGGGSGGNSGSEARRAASAAATFGRRLAKVSLHAYLFTDLLVLTRKRSDQTFHVLDYCPRSLIQLEACESLPCLTKLPAAASASHQHLMLLTLLSNHEGRTVEMALSCARESDRERWLEAVSPPAAERPDERVYEQWDCPQVQALHAYTASQSDELSLQPGDVVNVYRKTADGWQEGERLRDCERGWYPANHVREVASAHLRARNFKQRHRLLALTSSYLQQTRPNK